MHMYTALIVLTLIIYVLCIDIPPAPLHDGIHSMVKKLYTHNIDDHISEYDPELDKGYAWELSGLFEGDIMTMNASDAADRNVLLDESKYWPQATVPYFVSNDFNNREKLIILGAIKEIHRKSCVRFRPYRTGDEAYILIRGSKPGCWSYVGRAYGGQVVNLQKKGCVHHGTVVHELLHSLGFYHQQSAADRDRYVKIMWDNIAPNKFGNFENYSPREVTDFRVGYDYNSVMHYEPYAFTKNGRRTIIPYKKNADLGQRRGMSIKDARKLNSLYKCRK